MTQLLEAWAATDSAGVSAEGTAYRVGSRRIVAWPDVSLEAQITVLAEGEELVLITADAQQAVQHAMAKGLRAGSRMALMQAETEDLDLAPHLPSDAYLALAPMGSYDVIELALFDKPVGRARLGVGDGLAVVNHLSVDDGQDDQLALFEHAMVAGLGDEAFAHGADTLFLIASQAQARRFATVEGWAKVAEILSFTE